MIFLSHSMACFPPNCKRFSIHFSLLAFLNCSHIPYYTLNLQSDFPTNLQFPDRDYCTSSSYIVRYANWNIMKTGCRFHCFPVDNHTIWPWSLIYLHLYHRSSKHLILHHTLLPVLCNINELKCFMSLKTNCNNIELHDTGRRNQVEPTHFPCCQPFQ